MNLVILTDSDRQGESRFRLTDNRAEHIRSVLKRDEGDKLEIGLVNGPVGTASIVSADSSAVELELVEQREARVPATDIHLVCALPRPQTVRKVLGSIATFGVRRCDFIRANRVERSYYQSPLIDPEKMRPYLLEGLAQGKLTRLPEVAVHERFRPFMEDLLPQIEQQVGGSVRLLPEPGAGDTLTTQFDRPPERVTLAIGPEGGWVPFEIDLMTGLGFQEYRLSRSILRVETAVVAALAQIELLEMDH